MGPGDSLDVHGEDKYGGQLGRIDGTAPSLSLGKLSGAVSLLPVASSKTVVSRSKFSGEKCSSHT